MLRFTRILRSDDGLHHVDHVKMVKMILSSDAIGKSFVAKVNGDLHCRR